MDQKRPRTKGVSKSLHKVEGGRVKKARKPQEPATTHTIKAGSIKSILGQEFSQTQKQGQVAKESTNVASNPSPASTTTSVKQPSKAVILSESDWHPSKLAANLKRLSFSKGREEFNIKDHHLDLVVAAGANFCHKLEEFSCGDDSTGYGSELSDAAVIRLAAACPNLRKVYLTSATRLTDDALLAFFTHCPKIHTLSITGNDKGKGNIKGSALLELKKDKEMAKQLRKLDLVDQQSLDHKYLKSVGTARKQLVITEGDSSEKSYDFGSISTWKGGKLKLDNSSFDDWF
ncbi:hypothetical protein PV11_08254 [Exophiala sideris]|uniref:Uncharacterized protein n=1 Tax=Exophiala sideris TaxID=1016849 RepID=A0A0D1YCS3_9EURO|nr:hypothetical protein PV11_08254 [Exophiala sideris]